MNDFRDSLKIYLNDKLIRKDFFETDESTGVCDLPLTVSLNRKSSNYLEFKKWDGELVYHYSLKPNFIEKYCLVRHQWGFWSIELTSKLLEFE